MLGVLELSNPTILKILESVIKTYMRNESSACRMLLVNVDDQCFEARQT